MSTAAAAAPRVADVVARLRGVEEAAAPGDGVACFARLYREVTEAVGAQLHDRRDDFVERLDILFAGLFFDAVDAFAHDPATVPRAWAPLFAARSRRGIAPLQFALAGMNAHINRDLPVALVRACAEQSLPLADDSREHRAFERIDRLAHRCDRLDDVVAMWDVARARDAAWANARVLWQLRDVPALADEYLATLDRTTGLASRGLLVPADTALGKLARLLRRIRP